MSTLDVTCGRCARRFRVRAEFAGKSTRCPGCSAPITIAGATPPPPPHREPDERPRPRPRPKEDDDRPSGPSGDWRPVAAALGREQVAVLFVLVTILCSYLVFCIGNAAGGPGGSEQALVIGLMMLMLVGPSLVAGVFGLAARVSALGAPRESLARGSAVPSLLCGLAALASLVMFGIALLSSIDRQQSSELPGVVASGGLILSTLGAFGTFLGFVAQVGIARRSAEVSRGVGRTAAAASVCVLVLLGIGMFYTLVTELTEPGYGSRGGPFGGGYYRDDSPFYQVVLGILIPLALAVVLILYHRLLAAARRSVLDEATERVND